MNVLAPNLLKICKCQDILLTENRILDKISLLILLPLKYLASRFLQIWQKLEYQL